MVRTQKPTTRTRHMKIKNVVLLLWCEIDRIILTIISTTNNVADGLTKPLTTLLFTRHRGTILGNISLSYINYAIPTTN